MLEPCDWESRGMDSQPWSCQDQQPPLKHTNLHSAAKRWAFRCQYALRGPGPGASVSDATAAHTAQGCCASRGLACCIRPHKHTALISGAIQQTLNAAQSFQGPSEVWRQPRNSSRLQAKRWPHSGYL